MPNAVMMKKDHRHGFTMIEVLVAATILVVIVMMLGMLFQQSSVAWRTGLMRSAGYTQLRAVIGAIQRDASAMIDSNQIPEGLLYNKNRSQYGQEFEQDQIQFYTMTGADNYRALNFIVYELGTESVKRKQRRLDADERWSSEEVSEILDFVRDSGDLNKPAVSVERFSFAFPDADEFDSSGRRIQTKNRYPLFLTVDAKVTQRGQLYDVGAECGGPDRTIGSGPLDPASRDDIRTWVQ